VKWKLDRLVLMCSLWVVAMVVACGGGGGVGTDGTGPSISSVNVGVTTGIAKNGLTVNGVSYDSRDASVTDGFGQEMSAEDLRLGMWVEVSSRSDDTGGTAVAQAIRVRPAARGVVSTVDGEGYTVTVLDSRVHYDSATTVIDGVDTLSQIKSGDLVEVHGLLGEESGMVEASRIERLPVGTRTAFELRGRVSELDTVARTFTLNHQQVRYNSASLTLGRPLANGQSVRVSASAPSSDGRPWTVERVTVDQPLPDNLDVLHLDGLTTDWMVGPTFKLEDVLVNADMAIGKRTVTGNGQRVSVTGALQSGTLKARSVFRRSLGQPLQFSLGAPITDYQSIAEFRVRGVSIDATSATFVNGGAADLVNGKSVRITGSFSGRRLIASTVELL
jgi:Domain of unknown function (DUF5666)